MVRRWSHVVLVKYRQTANGAAGFVDRHPAGWDNARKETSMSHDNATSLSLLQRIRNGDASGWRRVVELYTPLVYHWCHRWGVDNADADDVLQEVFAAAAASIVDFRREQEGDTFRGWLRAITRHKVLAFWRSRERHPESPGGSSALHRLQEVPEPEEIVAEDDGDADQMSALFHRALGMLRGEFEPRTWQAFWRTAVDAQSAPDVAAELGMSANAIRMAKSRVLRRLREELGDLVQ
jgi:RNA polymerase sigma-70 factor (ECF subfamily)